MPGGTGMGEGRRLELAGHLTVMELFERYRGAEYPAVKAHLQVICLNAQGWQTRDVARSTRFKTDWLRRLVRRYNEHGPESLGDRRASNSREPLLSEAQRQELLAALAHPSPYGGLWTSGKVARWIGERLGRKVWRALLVAPQRAADDEVARDEVDVRPLEREQLTDAEASLEHDHDERLPLGRGGPEEAVVRHNSIREGGEARATRGDIRFSACAGR